ncbi:hypothetical protein [Mucilaginibacter agri]|uniref:Uncharacterized protein n=1 Tax=Mucilaginibacter agri TaxID=2695265 RepID=A0A965ZGT3_9SPHI|nr:hypothetical protein [Mucilaginibacter agri]NCD69883.1 hypothetical protein [Mucilaginibacter agri]
MATTKGKTASDKSEASREMRSPNTSKEEKSAAAKNLASGSKKRSGK